jgi:DNA-3-methyladenine glycosylase
MRLARPFFDRPTLLVARDLIGKVLVHQTRAGVAAGRIIEVEAYIGEDDPACHAAPGPTRRNRPLYGPPGFSYVYLNYGMHYLTNLVTEAEGAPAAVLIRALEPLDGLDLMRRRRSRASGRPGAEIADRDLCRGPGNLSSALGISLRENARDLTSGPIWLDDRGLDPAAVAWSPRIGISVGIDRLWRCYDPSSSSVSGARRQEAAAGRRPSARMR